MVVRRRALLPILVAAAVPAESNTALLVIDVQACFVEGGSLAVPGGSGIIPKINVLIEEKSCLFNLVVRSRDYHPPGHISFASTHHAQPFTSTTLHCISKGNRLSNSACCLVDQGQRSGATCDGNPTCGASNPACAQCADNPQSCFAMNQSMWPDHCLQRGDSGLMTLASPPPDEPLLPTIVVQKGYTQLVDAYSAFRDNTKTLYTSLDATLRANGVDTVYIVGLATDYCVYETVVDALELGYRVFLVEDATAGISVQGTATAIADMRHRNATIIRVSDAVAMPCPRVHGAAARGGARGEGGSWRSPLGTVLLANLVVAALAVGCCLTSRYWAEPWGRGLRRQAQKVTRTAAAVGVGLTTLQRHQADVSCSTLLSADSACEAACELDGPSSSATADGTSAPAANGERA